MLDAKYTRSLYMLHKNDDNNKLEKIVNGDGFYADEAKFICSYILKEKSGNGNAKLAELLSSNDKSTLSELEKLINDIAINDGFKFTDRGNFVYYILAFFVPLIGIILGIVFIAKNKESEGKSLLIFSVAMLIVFSLVIYYILFK